MIVGIVMQMDKVDFDVPIFLLLIFEQDHQWMEKMSHVSDMGQEAIILDYKMATN